MSDPDRYKSRGRKERTPEQLKVLEMAREKARLVIAERTKIKREMEETVSSPPEPEAEPEPAESEETEPPTPPPEPEPPVELPAEPTITREEIQNLIHSTLNPPERRYTLVDGMYVKIK
jgi:hypothetical protein